MTDHWLLILGVSMGGVIIALLTVTLFSKWWIRREFLAKIAEDRENRTDARAEATAFYEDALKLFKAMRDLAASARDNRKETAVAVERVRDQLTEHPSREDLARRLEQVPEETARKVRESLPPGGT